MNKTSMDSLPALPSDSLTQSSAYGLAHSRRLSEIRYRRLFETAKDGILTLESEWGRVTDANPFMTELLGYSHDELVGKELWEIGLLKDKRANQAAFQHLKQHGYIRYEDLPLENLRGERREVEFVSNLYLENGRTVIQCNIRDITDRKRVEVELAATAIRYRRLFEMAQDGILILDSDEGRVTDANPFMTKLLGYTHDELIGKELWEIGLLKDKEDSQHAFQRLKETSYIRYDDLPLENRRGERLEVEFVSNLYRERGHTVIQCSIRDITDRRRVEAELAVAAAKNERIAETLQRSMLLASPAGKFPGLAVETLYESALDESDVGGDFFDAFAIRDDKVALVVGDVSGKGLVAAGRTAEVKYALRAFLHEYPTPEIALARLNNFVCETHHLDNDMRETFIVLALVVVDNITGAAVFTAAGAESSLILRADGTVDQVEVIGMPLGVQPEAAYTSKKLSILPGDTVLMATDGITEARHGGAFLGVNGFVRLAQNAGPATTLPALSEAIYGGARNFGGGALRDDVCLLLARRLRRLPA